MGACNLPTSGDPTAIPPYIWGCSQLPLDQIADVGVRSMIKLSTYLKLFGREIIFEVFQVPTYMITVLNVTIGQIDYLLWNKLALRSIAR